MPRKSRCGRGRQAERDPCAIKGRVLGRASAALLCQYRGCDWRNLSHGLSFNQELLMFRPRSSQWYIRFHGANSVKCQEAMPECGSIN